jgi:hypothetical protein
LCIDRISVAHQAANKQFDQNAFIMKIIKGNFNGSNVTNQPNENNITHKIFLGRIATQDTLSEQLMELLLPIMHAEDTEEELTEKIELGIVGWNMEVLTRLDIPNYLAIIEKSMLDLNLTSMERELVHQLIEKKQQHIQDFPVMIERFELEENDTGIFEFMAFTQPVEYGQQEEEMDEEDEFQEQTARQFEEGYINRMALLVKPKDAFFSWLKQVDKDVNESTLSNLESSIYMIHEDYEDSGAEKWVKKNFDRIFSEELYGWVTDPSLWPQKRTFRMFQDFFTVSFHSMIYDFESTPVLKD